MTKKSFHLLLLLFPLSGCLFHPQMADIPLISEKKELRIDAGVSFIPAAQATVSYGLTNKIAIQGFANFGPDEYYLQAATGLYKKRNVNQVLEAYGGFGYGYADLFSTETGGSLIGDFQTYFTQVNYGKIADEDSNFEAALSLKTGYLQTNLTDDFFYNIDTSNGTYQGNNLLIEPAGQIRLGGKKFKLNIKLAYNYLYKLNNPSIKTPYSKFNFGIGLNYNLR